MSSSRDLLPGKTGLSIRHDHPGRVIVFTNGCFDILHPGHFKVLRHCRHMAGLEGVVVVGLNSDESIRRLKGPNRPILDQLARYQMVRSIQGVTYVDFFDEDTPYRLIRDIMPHFIVKGGDYKPHEVVGQDLAHVEVVPYDPQWSTTKIIERIRNG